MTSTNDYDPQDLRKTLVKISGETAGLLRDLACTDLEKLSKVIKGETTEVDQLAEDYIIGALKEEFGRIKVVTEEKGVVGEGDLTAVVDPLDGSRNYLNCIPWSSVSIAVGSSGSTLTSIIAGAVAPIFYGQPISFARGEGCFVGARKVAQINPPEKFIYVYIEHPDAARKVAEIIVELGLGYKVRSLGSAALELSYIGLGRGTAFVDLRSKLRNVDIAAASGIVRECGGEVVDGKGSVLDTSINSVVKAGTVIAVPSKELVSKVVRPL